MTRLNTLLISAVIKAWKTYDVLMMCIGMSPLQSTQRVASSLADDHPTLPHRRLKTGAVDILHLRTRVARTWRLCSLFQAAGPDSHYQQESRAQRKRGMAGAKGGRSVDRSRGDATSRLSHRRDLLEA